MCQHALVWNLDKFIAFGNLTRMKICFSNLLHHQQRGIPTKWVTFNFQWFSWEVEEINCVLTNFPFRYYFFSLSRTMFFNTFLIIIALLTLNEVCASQWWNGWSPHDNNDRYQREPLPATPAVTKTEFKQLWYTILTGPVGTNPTIYRHRVYVPTNTGMFYCLHADSGTIMWQRNLSAVINNGHIYISRTSPLVYKDTIILGVLDGSLLASVASHGSYVIALNRFTGVLRWQTRVSSHPASIITSTPQLANGHLYIGISSFEESFSINPNYPCCTFQGSVVALKAGTGKFIWETKMIPDNNGTTTGYSGK